MMFVDRYTFSLKPRKVREAVALMKAENERYTAPRTYRVYTSHTGSQDTLVYEVEFENLTEQEDFWMDWGASPEAQTFGEKFDELRGQNSTRETLRLE